MKVRVKHGFSDPKIGQTLAMVGVSMAVGGKRVVVENPESYHNPVIIEIVGGTKPDLQTMLDKGFDVEEIPF